MKSRFTVLALSTLLSPLAFSGEPLKPVTTTTVPVSILSVDGATVRAHEFDPSMGSITALVDVDVTVEGNVMCSGKDKVSDHFIVHLPFRTDTLSLLQECKIREEFGLHGFAAYSNPSKTTVLVRFETYAKPVRDENGKIKRDPTTGERVYSPTIENEIKLPYGYAKAVKGLKLTYTPATKQIAATIAELPAPETGK